MQITGHKTPSMFRRYQIVPAVARIAAARELFKRAYGLPKAHVEMTHEIGKDAVSLLIEIASSDRHRAELESLERERMQRRAITVGVEQTTK